MNFTREPIIETIISPKEGCKLLVRSSKSATGAEEYYVDAVEVVSFGRAFFFRSMERPKAFLVPVSDYEVLEVKETKVALKNVSHERNIKIGGGRESPPRHAHREPPQEREQEVASGEEEPSSPGQEEPGLETVISARMDKRRDRRRRRHRRSADDQDWNDRRPQEGQPQQEGESKTQTEASSEEAKVSVPMFSALIPPPTTLISDTIGRYKDKEFMEGTRSTKETEPKEEKKKKEPPAEEEPTGSESAPLHRVIQESSEAFNYTSTNFSPLQGGQDSFFF